MKLLYSLLALFIFVEAASCKKDTGNESTIVPLQLTEKLWQLDTILINAPHTYDDLTDDQKFSYNASLAWSMDKAQITFKNDHSIICSGDWDYGYTRWQLINNDKDIKVNQGSGFDTLRLWYADDKQFTYIHSVGTDEFDCTFIYK